MAGAAALPYKSDLHIFFLDNLWWITLVEFENQIICISKMADMALSLYTPIATALAKIFKCYIYFFNLIYSLFVAYYTI